MTRLVAAFSLLMLASVAHAGPLPPDKQNYIGEWEGHGVSLTITPAGSVKVHKESGGFSKSFEGLFAGFDGNDLKVSVVISSFTVHIQEPPYLDRGVWLMTVEGAKVLRKDLSDPATGSRKSTYEGKLRDGFVAKGISVKSIFCPEDVAHKDLFACVLTTALGDVFPVKCVIDAKGTLDYQVDAALLDQKALQGFIVENFQKKPGVKVDAQCPGPFILKKPADVFECRANHGKKIYPVKVTVKDVQGNVSIDY